MMTIKEFAALCRCNAQTLRYYDKIDLLKPVHVDAWTGYRYYDKAQAIDFVKIKNLQSADFSIEEIKALLQQDDQQVYAAFEEKIRAQEHKLAKIRAIQQSYLKEKMDMEKMVGDLADFMLGLIGDYEQLRDFGLDPKDGEAIARTVKDYMTRMVLNRNLDAETVSLKVNDEIVYGAEAAERIKELTWENLEDDILLGDENMVTHDEINLDEFDVIWQADGWGKVRDFIDQIPPLEKDGEYCLKFHMQSVKLPEDFSFALFMLGAMITKHDAGDILMGCSLNDSDDGQNHFALLRRK